jgi:hypothetical protein
MLGDKAPAPMLYDFVASQADEMFSYWYGLELEGKQQYEDARVHGTLAVHTSSVFKKTAKSRGWPPYFPPAVTGEPTAEERVLNVPLEIPEPSGEGPIVTEQSQDEFMREIAAQGGVDKAYIEGWALYTKQDLFFFYAVAPRPLTAAERNAALAVMNSLQFDALLGGAPESVKTEQ